MFNIWSKLQEKLPSLAQGNPSTVTTERAKIFHFVPQWYRLELVGGSR